MKIIKLNNGNEIPAIGFGVFMIPNNGETKKAVTEALKAGYRHIDTAAAYFNEAEVGEAVRESGIPREDIVVTSKLWIQDYGYEAAKKGIETSLKNLNIDYIDLYLLHQPYGDTAGAWKALEEAYRQGLLKNIGVSNHTVERLQKLLPQIEIMPQVDQVEYNVYYQEKKLRDYLKPYDIKLEAYFPFGHGDKRMMNDPVITDIANKHGKSVQQTMLRFYLQEQVVSLPKSTSPRHIQDNIHVFDFELSESEMKAIRKLDTDKCFYSPNDGSNGEMLLRNCKIND